MDKKITLEESKVIEDDKLENVAGGQRVTGTVTLTDSDIYALNCTDDNTFMRYMERIGVPESERNNLLHMIRNINQVVTLDQLQNPYIIDILMHFCYNR